MADRLEGWFKSEVLVHEGILMRFLARVWPRRADLADLRQETYIRVYEAAQQSIPSAPKAFLFSVARHVLIDRRRRERIVSIQTAGDNDFSNDLIEEKTPERWVGARQEFARLAHALDRLPPKCREVVWMRRVLNLTQKEVALRLNVSEKTVEYHICASTRLLAQYLQTEEDTSGQRVETRRKPTQPGGQEHGE
jgi:RNA polymerase sigma factor (sigma-70 family)